MLHFFLDKVPQPVDHTKAKTATPKENIPAAGEDAEAGPDEHQRRYLGPTAQEEY